MKTILLSCVIGLSLLLMMSCLVIEPGGGAPSYQAPYAPYRDLATDLERNLGELYNSSKAQLTEPTPSDRELLEDLDQLWQDSKELQRYLRFYPSNEMRADPLINRMLYQAERIDRGFRYQSSFRMFRREWDDSYSILKGIANFMIGEVVEWLTEEADRLYTKLKEMTKEKTLQETEVIDNLYQFWSQSRDIDLYLGATYFNKTRLLQMTNRLQYRAERTDRQFHRLPYYSSLEEGWEQCLALTDRLTDKAERIYGYRRPDTPPEEKGKEKKVANIKPVAYIDIATAQEVAGWAFDEDAGTAPIEVHIYLDEKHIATLTANLRRDDLVGKVKGLKYPLHGFRWTPPPLSPGRHTIKVYAINVPPGGNILIGTRIVFIPPKKR